MNSPWRLSEQELFTVEQEHRDLMARQAVPIEPIKLSLDNANLRARAENIAEAMIEAFGHQDAEAYFAGAFTTAQADQLLRMSLQPGTTKNVNGKTYVLNRNHRWQNAEQMPQAQRQPARQETQQNRMPKRSPAPKEPRKPKAPSKPSYMKTGDYKPDVTADNDGDGVTDAARVGVPAKQTPPPPKRLPRISGLKGKSKAAEEELSTKFEKDPRQMSQQVRKLFYDIALGKAKEKQAEAEKELGRPVPLGKIIPEFGTDDAKSLSKYWAGGELDKDPEKRAENRSTLNIALHQAANAITKRGFIDELDTLPEGSNILVTVGGCGAGKGYALKNVPEAVKLKQQSSVVWDSAGDQNATENVWIQKEAEKRGLNVTYFFVNADAQNQWANPKIGVVARAKDTKDGRMVGAKVFADSYAIGAKNHQKFYERNKTNPNAKFMFVQTGKDIYEIPGIPKESLNLDRKALEDFAVKTIQDQNDLPARIREGALQGQKIWRD